MYCCNVTPLNQTSPALAASSHASSVVSPRSGNHPYCLISTRSPTPDTVSTCTPSASRASRCRCTPRPSSPRGEITPFADITRCSQYQYLAASKPTHLPWDIRSIRQRLQGVSNMPRVVGKPSQLRYMTLAVRCCRQSPQPTIRSHPPNRNNANDIIRPLREFRYRHCRS